jgi:hypothetical protein
VWCNIVNKFDSSATDVRTRTAYRRGMCTYVSSVLGFITNKLSLCHDTVHTTNQTSGESSEHMQYRAVRSGSAG